MKWKTYRENVERDPEYREAKEALKLHFALANTVLRRRLEKGWSQTELARRVGTRQANISRIEAGLGNPTLELIKKLCDALEMEVDFRPLEVVVEGPVRIVGKDIEHANVGTAVFEKKPNYRVG